MLEWGKSESRRPSHFSTRNISVVCRCLILNRLRPQAPILVNILKSFFTPERFRLKFSLRPNSFLRQVNLCVVVVRSLHLLRIFPSHRPSEDFFSFSRIKSSLSCALVYFLMISARNNAFSCSILWCPWLGGSFAQFGTQGYSPISLLPPSVE